MHITTALIMIPSEFPKPWMFKFHSSEFNTELTEIQQSTNLDSINDYIWEEPAWKAQAFGVLPTTLPSTGYRKKKNKTKRNPRLHIYFCMNSLVEDSKNLDKILKKKKHFFIFLYLSTSGVFLIFGETVLAGEKQWVYKPDMVWG